MNDSSVSLSHTRNVSKAVARSRSIRAGVKRRRRRLAMLAACATTIAGAPVAWFMAEPAAAVVTSAASEVRDLADMLGQRSPGARTEALLNKHARVAAKVRSKPKTVAGHPAAPVAPATTALIDLLQPPVAPVTVASNGVPPVLAPPVTFDEILNSMPGGGIFTPPGGGTFTPPGGGTFTPPGGGAFTPPGGGGGSAHLPTSEPQELVTSAVPEPQTWALMLLGFGLIGFQLRRNRRAMPAKAARRAAN